LAEGGELLAVQAPVLAHVDLVLPCRDGGELHGVAHARAEVGAVEAVAVQERRIAGDEAGAQSRRVRALRERSHREKPRVALASERLRGGEAAQRRRRLVEIHLAVALVRADDEDTASEALA